MTPQDMLQQAQELLKTVMRFDQPTDLVVARFFKDRRYLGARDRAMLADMVYTVIRQKPLFQHLARLTPSAKAGPGASERRWALLGLQNGQGDMQWLERALSPNELAWLEQARGVDVSTLPKHLQHNLPAWLADELAQTLGADFEAFTAAINQSAPLDLRVNILKMKREQAQQQLADLGIQAQPTPYSPWGLRVAGKPALHKLPLFVDGSLEVQDEGSQLLALLVGAKRGDMVVDFCAGAGGKTLALGAALRNTGRLYAWDVSAHRLDALKPRMARSGLSNIHPAALAHERDARVKRLHGKADRVLIDAPCSGLGTLRRSPDLKWRQSPQSVQELAVMQTAILESACKLLKPGGRLVYATCSVLHAENEDIVQAFNASHPEFGLLPVQEVLQAQGVKGAENLVQGDYLRLWPHQHATDGFFAAVWQRQE